MFWVTPTSETSSMPTRIAMTSDISPKIDGSSRRVRMTLLSRRRTWTAPKLSATQPSRTTIVFGTPRNMLVRIPLRLMSHAGTTAEARSLDAPRPTMDRRGSTDQVRILLALAGLHRVHRGAEVAFISVARELSKLGHEVTLIGSGPPRPEEPYRFIHAPAIARETFERWPSVPTLRSETAWEEATFVPGLLAKISPGGL